MHPTNDHVERERKLDAPDGFSLARLSARFDGYVVAPAELQRLHTIYYDSADLRLARWGASLRYRHPDGWTLKVPVPGSDDALARIEHEFPAPPGAVPPEALEVATGFLRGAAVEPVAELRTLRMSRRIRSAGGENLAEVVEDDVRVIADNAVVHRFRQLEVELAEHAPAEVLDTVAGALRDEGATPSDAEKEVLALGPRAAEPPFAIPEIAADVPAGDVFRAAFAAATERLIRSDAFLRRPGGDDPEPVHQARVAVRRLRSHLRSFAPILDRTWAAELAERLRWWGDALGEARDADVLGAQLRERAAALPPLDRPQIEEVLATFRARRDDAYRTVARDLRDARYVPLLDAVIEAAERPAFGPRAFEPACDVLPELIATSWRKLRKAVRRRSRPPQDPELHRIRIRAKRVRYVAEAVAPALGRDAERLAACAEDLQGVLGEQHDAVVAYQRLRESAAGSAAFAAGELAALAAGAAEAGRHEWRPAWRAVKRQRFWR
jgi:CHAD domain-containing protein